jgi:hypothetical protein
MTSNWIGKAGALILTLVAGSSLSAQPNANLRFRNEVNDRNPLRYLLKHEKALAITAIQKDSIKVPSRALDEEEKPGLSEMGMYYDQHPDNGKLAFTIVPSSSTGGAPPSTSASAPIGLNANPDRGQGAESPLSPPIALIQVQLFIKQDTYRERIRTLLNETQNHPVDSVMAGTGVKTATDRVEKCQ